ncbi:flagellar basal body P-ring formation chaperone FlgA [Erwinia sp. Leaf53]|uniref:flagellar basal body P-ring formation chaperone FlgA n=1 Tax=Erwinia sp. Leaf53 TaxID=1736225 RepID=UPI0006FFA23A|nr:flagellar basal body P-ring formation chaperone FlgA [Erwinia sp. Leaf53]KQN56678.1 flagellar biosynthesis protein FlgA [Erwinia sp. Leaf53]
MQKVIRIVTVLLTLLAATASAGDLSSQLNQFFKARYGQSGSPADTLNVAIKTPEKLWPSCEKPQFSLPGNGRMWGNMSVAANCDRDRRYIQVQVQVTGSYVVAARAVQRGTPLTAGDLRLMRGRLDTLPARTLLDLQQGVEAIALRDLVPGQPVTQMMMRQPWRVKAGQTVRVVASGDGFNITNEGKAMNNATVAQNVRVRLSSGQIVSGPVGSDGNVLISL